MFRMAFPIPRSMILVPLGFPIYVYLYLNFCSIYSLFLYKQHFFFANDCSTGSTLLNIFLQYLFSLINNTI